MANMELCMQQESESFLSGLYELGSKARMGDEFYVYEHLVRFAEESDAINYIERPSKEISITMLANFLSESEPSVRAKRAERLRYETLTIINHLRYTKTYVEFYEKESDELIRLGKDLSKLYMLFLACSDFDHILSAEVEFDDEGPHDDSKLGNQVSEKTVPTFRYSKKDRKNLIDDLVSEGFLSDQDGMLFYDILCKKIKIYEDSLMPVWLDSKNSIINFMLIGVKCNILDIKKRASPVYWDEAKQIKSVESPARVRTGPCVQAAIINALFYNNPYKNFPTGISNEVLKVEKNLKDFRELMITKRKRSMAWRDVMMEASDHGLEDTVCQGFPHLDFRIMNIYGNYLISS